MCGGKSRMRAAGGRGGRHTGKIRDLRTPTPGIVDLMHRANIWEHGPISDRERSTGEAAEQCFKRYHAGPYEVLHPSGTRVWISGDFDSVYGHLKVANRVEVDGDCMGQGLDFCALDRIVWQETQTVHPIKVCQNREGLRETVPVDLEYGHKTLRVSRQMVWGSVFAFQKVDRFKTVADTRRNFASSHRGRFQPSE